VFKDVKAEDSRIRQANGGGNPFKTTKPILQFIKLQTYLSYENSIMNLKSVLK